MQMRFLEYLVALAREQHFGRAAAACNVAQPTLSAGLAALENQLGGARLVDRDRRFVRLTEEGEAVLPWALAVLADYDELQSAVRRRDGRLEGELRLGVIPAAMPISGRLIHAVTCAHPEVSISLRSMTSREIEAGLVSQQIHAGLTYLHHEPLPQVHRVPLYRERFMFVTHAERPLADRRAVSWQDVSREPLCLLHQGMQNRRILDEHLGSLKLNLRAIATTDSYVTLVAMVDAGGFSTVISDAYIPFMHGLPNLRVIPFAAPAPTNDIGLVVLERPALAAHSAAALSAAKSIELANF